MDVPHMLRLIAGDIGIVVVVSVGIGATAPRWPTRWLTRDRGPLRLTRYDTPENYWRLGVPRWARRLPEAGSAFGGANKRTHPRRTDDEIRAYLVEARRGEWVHWLSMLSIIALAPVNPWWLWLAFTFVVIAVNFTFIAILRNNRVRLTAALRRGSDA